MKKQHLLILLLALSINLGSYGQEQINDVQETKKEKKADNKAAKKAKKNKPPEKGDIYFSPVPVIGVNPAFGFIYGVGASTSWFMGKPGKTKLSNLLAGIALTTKSQTIITFKSNVYTENNNYIFMGDWRYLNSSQPTWGLGTGPQSAKLVSSGFEYDDGNITNGMDEAQMLQFKQIRFYETVLKKFKEGIYFGVGFHFDQYNDIVDPLVDLEAEPPVVTSFYAYNVEHGFDQEKNTLVGLSLNAVYDTRDNQNNPYKGRYAFASFKYNPEFIGSDQNSSTLWLEIRNYWNFTPKDNHNILALWVWGNFNTSGDLPYMGLPALGYDVFAKSGRPYPQGRFRGQNVMYSEIEFRKHIWATKKNSNFLGAVAYINATTASAEANDIGLFEYINPGYGVGLRLNISEKARTNLGIDYGWGSYGAKGLYIRLNETF